MPAGELWGSDATLMASPWGTQECGAEGIRVAMGHERKQGRRGPVRLRVRMLQRRPEVHWVLLLG